MPSGFVSPDLLQIRRISLLLAQHENKFDQTLRAARSEIGDDPDLTNPTHSRRLRKWLNDWLCRIGYPQDGQDDEFVENLARWWTLVATHLPAPDRPLNHLDDSDLQDLAEAYGQLVALTSYRTRGGRVRSFGPTATAKILYFVRPLAVTAWDKRIAAGLGHGTDQSGFFDHLSQCQRWAADIVEEAR